MQDCGEGRCPTSMWMVYGNLSKITWIFHIGLPKTATTWFQQVAFPNFVDANGDGIDFRTINPAGYERFVAIFHEFVQQIETSEPETSTDFAVKSLLTEFLGELPSFRSGSLLVSLEGLSQWPVPGYRRNLWPVQAAWDTPGRTGTHPIIRFLDLFQQVSPDSVEVKTILTLRNQTDWLGSLANELEISNTLFVRWLVDNNDAFLDFHALVEGLLRSSGGSKGCLVLLFEDGLERNLAQISRFLGISVPAEIQSHHFGVMVNSKGGSHSRWESEVDRLTMLLRSLRRTFPRLHRKFSLKASAPVRYLARALGPALGSRKIVTVMSTPLRTELRAHCQETNRKLAELLGRDLEALNY